MKIVEEEKREKLKQRKEWAKNNACSSWKIHLKPGGKVVKKLQTINDYEGIAYKYDYRFKPIDVIPEKAVSEIALKASIKAKGQKYTLVEGLKIYYYVYDEIKGSYYFMFTNNDKKTLECEAVFELENMKLIDPNGPGNTWKFTLKPRQCLIKQVSKIVQRDKCSLCPSFSYKLA